MTAVFDRRVKSIEIDLMKVETRLDRLQNALRKLGLTQLELEARRALGELRSAMDYRNALRQQTLKRHIPHRYRSDGWKK